MRKQLLLGTILGGLAAFLWSTISWEILGWHDKFVHAFPNEAELTAAIASHPTPSGVYLLPKLPSGEGMTAEQAKAAKDAAIAQFQNGPIAFAAVRSAGFGSFAGAMVAQLLSLMLAAGLLTWLLLQTSGLSYSRRVLFVGVAGLASSVIVDLPNWNWWGFSGAYTAVNLADFTLMWLSAGLVMARVTRRA
jgi:hypothetical protein